MKEESLLEQVAKERIQLIEIKAKLKANLAAYKELAYGCSNEWEKYPSMKKEIELREAKYLGIVEFIEENFENYL